jgi:hypothetical protein
MRAARLLVVAALTCFAALPASAQKKLPNPADILGFEPGAERHLPSWKQITDYFTALDKASPRVSVRTIGKTVLGHPFIVAFISDSATLAHLEHYRQIQRKLMDPRLQAAGERQKLIDEGKNIILVTSSIHSTESGGFTTPIVLADRLARAETPEAKTILANTIIMMVPSQNPDGVDIVGDWYRSTLGTPREGSGPPDLYHFYAGHDDNRDWYAFTQPETRATVDSLYTPWDPEINNDLHQQGANSSRIFIPPYMDPVEPNIDPILTEATNQLGFSMAWRMTAEGFTGIASNAAYDQWSPARQYSLNHRGARLLTETASARLASPIDISFSQLGPQMGYNGQVASWNFPSLWPGGHWTYTDIVHYQTAASWALFIEAAENRKGWLEAYAKMGDRALGDLPAWGIDKWPSAFVIPRAQKDTEALHRLVWTLQHGQVELRQSTAPVTVDGTTYPAGSYIMPTKQPFGAYGKALLERQHYPNLFEYPGGPPKRPYDVTAHTLPLLFGVDVATVTGPEPAMGKTVAELPDPGFANPFGANQKRIAVYRPSANEPMDEGWTRYVFDVHHVKFTTITEKDLAAGNLHSKFDAIVFSDGSGNLTANAAALDSFVNAGGTILAFNNTSTQMAQALGLPVTNVLQGAGGARGGRGGGGRGGRGGGGTPDSAAAAGRGAGRGGPPSTDFYCPGSILAVVPNTASPIGQAFTAPVPGIWFEGSPAFEITDSTAATAVLTYPATGNVLLSGWLLGGEKLNGKAALVDVKRGSGHVVLYGFRPQYRGQPNATFPLIWAAMR